MGTRNLDTRGRNSDVRGPSARKGPSNREWIAFTLFLVLALIVCVRLVDLQIIRAGTFSKAAQSQRTNQIEVSARRGTIYDRNGNVLATSVDAMTIYANPSEVDDPDATAAELAAVLGGEAADYASLLEGDSTFVYIKRKADLDKAEALKTRAYELKQAAEKTAPDDVVVTTVLSGIYYLDDWKRYYPYGDVGSQVIGYVGFDGNGLSGLELEYDTTLAGIDGQLITEVGADGTPVAGGTQTLVPAEDGVDIITTLDVELQAYAEEQLLALGTERETEDGSVIVVDGKTGDIYAAASLPLYSFSSEVEYKPGSESLKCVVTSYEPGSIFKTTTAASALEEKVMDTEEELAVPAELVLGEYTITDAHERYETETMSLRTIMAQSSNIGISMVEEKIGDETFCERLRSYGFGATTGVDYPGEAQGSLADARDWSPHTAASISFGQGVSVSALQMASFYGAVANDGVYVSPHFLISANTEAAATDAEGGKKADTDSATADSTSKTDPADKTDADVGTGTDVDSAAQTGTAAAAAESELRILSRETCKKLDSILASVITDGTGGYAAIEGYTAAGKTGTAEVASADGGYRANYYIISFAGYLPNSGSALACVTTYTDPSDAEIRSPAATLFSRVMSYAAERYVLAPG